MFNNFHIFHKKNSNYAPNFHVSLLLNFTDYEKLKEKMLHPLKFKVCMTKWAHYWQKERILSFIIKNLFKLYEWISFHSSLINLRSYQFCRAYHNPYTVKQRFMNLFLMCRQSLNKVLKKISYHLPYFRYLIYFWPKYKYFSKTLLFAYVAGQRTSEQKIWSCSYFGQKWVDLLEFFYFAEGRFSRGWSTNYGSRARSRISSLAKIIFWKKCTSIYPRHPVTLCIPQAICNICSRKNYKNCLVFRPKM